MSDPTLALQGWIVQTLSGASPPLPIYDRVPPSNPFPRVTVSSSECRPGEDDGQCGATFEIIQRLDVWTNSVGYPEVKTIAAAVKDLLHEAVPDLDGFAAHAIEWLSTDTFPDSNGLDRSARMIFRALIDEAPAS